MSLKLRKAEKTDLEQATNGVCENCGKHTKIRRVEAVDVFHGGSRGWYRICYKCFGPQIIWKKKGKEVHTPAKIPFNELDDFLEEYFESFDKQTERTEFNHRYGGEQE